MRLLISAAALAFAMLLGQPAKVEAAPVAPGSTGIELSEPSMTETVHWRRRGYRTHGYAPQFYFGLALGPAYYGGWRPRHYYPSQYYSRPHYYRPYYSHRSRHVYRRHYRHW